jgi:hypothetical protein
MTTGIKFSPNLFGSFDASSHDSNTRFGSPCGGTNVWEVAETNEYEFVGYVVRERCDREKEGVTLCHWVRTMAGDKYSRSYAKAHIDKVSVPNETADVEHFECNV